jgi:hypothetical protein
LMIGEFFNSGLGEPKSIGCLRMVIIKSSVLLNGTPAHIDGKLKNTP